MAFATHTAAWEIKRDFGAVLLLLINQFLSIAEKLLNRGSFHRSQIELYIDCRFQSLFCDCFSVTVQNMYNMYKPTIPIMLYARKYFNMFLYSTKYKFPQAHKRNAKCHLRTQVCYLTTKIQFSSNIDPDGAYQIIALNYCFLLRLLRWGR